MSIVRYLLFKDQPLPKHADWQTAINHLRDHIELDYFRDIEELDGFLPARINGKDAGFELLMMRIDENLLSDLELEAKDRVLFSKYDRILDFTTHSDLLELLSACYASAALAKLTDGLILETEGWVYMNAEQAYKDAQDVEAACRDILSN